MPALLALFLKLSIANNILSVPPEEISPQISSSLLVPLKRSTPILVNSLSIYLAEPK
jgi:hypothetical protein